MGHISRVCHSKGQQGANSVNDEPIHVVVGQPVQPFLSNVEYTLFPVVSGQSTFLLWRTLMIINGQEVQMEIDTGASVTLLSEATFSNLQTSTAMPPLEKANINLLLLEEIKTLGLLHVTVEKNGQKATLPLLVVAGTGQNLIERNWLAELHLDRKEVDAINDHHSVNAILEHNGEVYQPGLGLVKDDEAKLYVNTDARPLFFKAHSVPYAKVRA